MLSVENLFHTILAIMDKPPCSFLFRGFYIFNLYTSLHSLVHCCDHFSLSLVSMPTSIHHYYISDLTKHLSLLRKQSRPHTDVSSCCHCCCVCSYNKKVTSVTTFKQGCGHNKVSLILSVLMGVAERMDTSNVKTTHIEQACCFGKSLQFCLSLSYMANSTQ